MHPDPLLELFDASNAQLDAKRRDRYARVAALVHADQVQVMTARTAAARFAHAHQLNLIDFQVLQTVVAVGDTDQTATPGYICSQLSLSASTLTSILERLVARGLLVRERDSADRRRISVYYTAESAELIVLFYHGLTDSHDQSFGDLTDTQISDRVDFLHALTDCHQQAADQAESSSSAVSDSGVSGPSYSSTRT